MLRRGEETPVPLTSSGATNQNPRHRNRRSPPQMIACWLSNLALLGVALLLGAALYESLVIAPNYEREIPGSVQAAREFLKKRTPAHYFRPLAPLAQLLSLGSLIAGLIAGEFNDLPRLSKKSFGV